LENPWTRRFLASHDWKHSLELGRAEVVAFLSDLAPRRRVSASTQNQALAAILFLHGSVLEQDLPWLDGIVRAKRPRRVPVVLSRSEVRSLLGHMQGPSHLVATLLYGAGLRLLEALQLRVKDVDLESRMLTVRSGKGDRDRRALLPNSSRADLALAIEESLAQHSRDFERGAG
jgi:site-specific recombinase XerD